MEFHKFENHQIAAAPSNRQQITQFLSLLKLNRRCEMESLVIGWNLANQTVSRQYYEVFMSGNGQYAYGVGYLDGPPVRSNNHGRNYSDTALNPNVYWVGIGVSYTGQYVAAGPYPGPVEISDDYGLTWNPTNLVEQFWGSIAMSDSGQYIVATATDYGTAVSTDYGLSWNMSFVVAGLVTISPDGQTILGRGTIVGKDSFVYYSGDHGYTWLNTTEKILGKVCGNMWYGWGCDGSHLICCSLKSQ